jgi:hypothetical protein
VRRLFPQHYSWNPAELSVVTAPDTPVRLLVGPVNSAGQGWAWARAVERELDGVGAVDVAIETPGSRRFGYPADQRVPEMAFVFANQWRRRQRQAIAAGFSHLLLESGRFVFGNVPRSTPREAALGLAADGLAIALIWHGSDIRLPSRHAGQEPDSPFGPGGAFPRDRTAILERNASQNRELIETTDFPVFVSTPDLIPFAPRSQWLPVVVDAEVWQRAAASPPLERRVPIVVHAPSSAGLKGTEAIRPIMKRLVDEGLIEYRELHGIPAARMPETYGAADIVLDQFSLGIYGVAASEALAAGRVLISHVGDFTRRVVRERAGRELPIVEARAGELDRAIRAVLADRERYAALAASGPDFVRAVHSGRESARVLAPFLGAALRPMENEHPHE